MNKTLLLVDDEMYILQSLQRLLSKQGYQVLTAEGGAQGLKLLKDHPAQVVISDQRMPLMSGSEFIKKVRKLYPETICMILSAYIDFEALKDAINEGAIYKFISKPWQDSVVLTYVQDAFASVVKKEASQRTIHELVNHDGLTGLPNRYFFFEVLEEQIRAAQADKRQFAIVTIDINRFIKLNTLFGPQKADLLLQQIAKRLKKIINDENHLARMGNDEFVVLLMDAGELSYLIELINKLSALIKKPIVIKGNKYQLTASIGVALYPEHGDNAYLLMQHANIALESAKKLGIDNYQIYKPEIDTSHETQAFLIDEVYQSIGQKQFLAYYQPIYSAHDRKLVGLEALIRWQHPTKGLLLPGSFLTFCEETNLIIPIGAGILRAACQQVKTWQDRGFSDLSLAVNLSVNQINHPLFLDLVIDVLDSTQLPPNSLVLEVTESLLMQSTERVISLLNSLRSIGVQLSLDDFGTGYSSLSYLRKFPFNSLKIDQSFITAMTTTTTAEAIVDTIISLGKILNLQIIAEGVETEGQLVILQKKRCDLIQGYLFSAPLPAAEVEQLLINLDKPGTKASKAKKA